MSASMVMIRSFRRGAVTYCVEWTGLVSTPTGTIFER